MYLEFTYLQHFPTKRIFGFNAEFFSLLESTCNQEIKMDESKAPQKQKPSMLPTRQVSYHNMNVFASRPACFLASTSASSNLTFTPTSTHATRHDNVFCTTNIDGYQHLHFPSQAAKNELLSFLNDEDSHSDSYRQAFSDDLRSSGGDWLEKKTLVVVMVGLPARGKSHIARQLMRYLNWMGYATQVFNVGQYRRKFLGGNQSAEFFSKGNEEGEQLRTMLAETCMEDMIAWLQESGIVGIYDATNSTIKRRTWVQKTLSSRGIRVLFLESVCNDMDIITKNILQTKLKSPDYQGVEPEKAVQDFKERINFYEQANEPIQESENEHCSYIKFIDVGKQIVLNNITGFLQGKIVSFLVNSHILPRNIYLTRHGQSQGSLTGQIGGDPSITVEGEAYARNLSTYFKTHYFQKKEPLKVWTSQMKRARETAAYIHTPILSWKTLNEIDGGLCEGLTYEQVDQKFPQVAKSRAKDKLNYRYPGGESYFDVIYRLQPLILELERQRTDVLIVAHNAVIRSIYGYFTGLRQDECPHVDIPLHTLIKITPQAYGVNEERFFLGPESVDNQGLASREFG